jgi:diguanylate cyclase (GGDEF)-like protein/PAS domain S-box-containing protein
MGVETILVVDDNRQIADFLSGSLLPSLGYETVAAYTGRTALELIRKQEFALIISDLQLPDISGLDLLRQIVKEGYSIPTILSTAHGSEQVAVDAFRLGVHDYLVKPVDPDALGESIARALTESRLRREKSRLTGQLQEQVSWLAELTRVGRSVTSTLELDEVLRRIVEASLRLTGADEGFLALLDQQNDQLYLRAFKNVENEESKTIRLPVTDTLLGAVLKQKKPLRLNCDPGDSPIKVSTGFLVNNLLHVPILSKGTPLGVLSVDNRGSQRPFSERDEIMLSSLADYASAAIENARLYLKAQEEIEERVKADEALRESEERYALAVRGANEGLWDWSLKVNKIYYSPRWAAIAGADPSELTDSPDEWFSRIHPDDEPQIKKDILNHVRGLSSHFANEHRLQRSDGSYCWVLSRGIAVHDAKGVPVRMAGSLSDITDRKLAEQKLLHDALHDSLTGLPNRLLFMDRLGFAMERAKRVPNYLFAVLFLDLDRFKDVNDTLGHHTGDKLLVEIARMLEKNLRTTDTVARQGGDEFVILLDDIREISDATRIANRIQTDLNSSVVLDGREVYLTTSIGVVLSETGYISADDVLRDADIAMYRAKARGKARYEIFDPTMRDRIIHRLALESELRQAIEHNELCLHYQPIVSLTDGRLSGFEALVRWNHPGRGLLYPESFIHLAEETGLIIPLDRWVLQEACRQMVEWQNEFHGDAPLFVSVNLSGKQVAQPDLVNFISRVLDVSGLSPAYLTVEITERAIMENIEMASHVFRSLQALGIRIEIDDFGIGYSSLSYLAQLPINALKIDKYFVDLLLEGRHALILEAIVMLAHGLQIPVIAEGVETAEQLNYLRSLACENAQGYFFASPCDAEKVNALLRDNQTGTDRITKQLRLATSLL